MGNSYTIKIFSKKPNKGKFVIPINEVGENLELIIFAVIERKNKDMYKVFEKKMQAKPIKDFFEFNYSEHMPDDLIKFNTLISLEEYEKAIKNDDLKYFNKDDVNIPIIK